MLNHLDDNLSWRKWGQARGILERLGLILKNLRHLENEFAKGLIDSED